MNPGESAVTTEGSPVSADPSFFPMPAAGDGTGVAVGPALFTPDTDRGTDDLDRAGQAAFLAELAVHKQTGTPFCLALHGGAGAGKSFFLNAMMEAVAAASARGAGPGPDGGVLDQVLAVRVEATADDPGESLVAGVGQALAEAYPKLAIETLHAGSDPVQVAKDSQEALNEARRRLNAERQVLEDLEARQARLFDTALFEAGSSRIDAYARRNRSRIERGLRGFGFNSADPINAYKDLVREAAEAGGPVSKGGITLRALWSYQGQARLLVLAVILALVAWGAALLRGDQDGWMGWMRGFGDRGAPVADWAQAHAAWLQPIHAAALTLAALALVWNLVRAARFLQPIFKGVSLLGHDVDTRRRDINSQLAHQIRRVDSLTADADTLAARADEAERRATAHRATGLRDVALPGPDERLTGPRRDPARSYFNSLCAALSPGGTVEGAVPDPAVPRRIVVAIDGLDSLGADAAARFLQSARRLLGPGFVTVVAADRAHLANGFSETDPALASAHLGRCVDLCYNLGLPQNSPGDRSAYAMRLIEGGSDAPPAHSGADGQPAFNLAQPWRADEIRTVAALSPLAGDSPRAVKRFVNAYRIARADPSLADATPPVFTALALGLALDAQGFPVDPAEAINNDRGDVGDERGLFRRAFATAREASGYPVGPVEATRGLDAARRYASHG